MTIQEAHVAMMVFDTGLKVADCEKKRTLYNMALEAIWKTVPREIRENGCSGIEKACPHCQANLSVINPLPHYCPNCGQALTEEKQGE